jgi:hypothetical protein
MDLAKVFTEHEKEHGKFERIENPRHPRRDICAFLMLHDLDPKDKVKIVAGAEHDGIWLDTDCDELAKQACEQHIIDLIRCGVMYDKMVNSLFMSA